eukprot:CAMPEP_0168364504 /NCGR_PEP_ID=MMETSP0228-20121227/4241_1 /TAXON_ID=133427 /ORGANISM="Protoceratium reticulatum, Strain CCCM 535 (=CCMP 1889)" /LENGTH=235 /DNA_ID=CAMNT_0008377265 /DNA_START=821 /DNA_END=1528 /DNA_ORIENTATION=+
MCSFRKWTVVCFCYGVVYQGRALIAMLSGHGTQQMSIVGKKYLSTRAFLFELFWDCIGSYLLGGILALPFLWTYCQWYSGEQRLSLPQMLIYSTFYCIVPPCTPLPGAGTLGPNTMRAFCLGPLCPALSCSPVQLAKPSVPPTRAQHVLQFARFFKFMYFSLFGCEQIYYTWTWLQRVQDGGDMHLKDCLGAVVDWIVIPMHVVVSSGILMSFVQGCRMEWQSIGAGRYDSVAPE